MIYRLFGIGTPPTQRPGPTGPSSPLGRVATPETMPRDGYLPAAPTAPSRIQQTAQAHQRRGVSGPGRANANHTVAVVSGAMGSSPLAAAGVMLANGQRPTAATASSATATTAATARASTPPPRTSFAPSVLFDEGNAGPDISRLVDTARRPSPTDAFLSKSVSLRNAAGPYEVHVARTAALVFKKGFTSWPMGEPGQGLHMIDRTLGDKKDPLIACIRWDTGMQSVIVDRSENGRIHFRAAADDPRHGSLPPESGHLRDGAGFESLPSREFEQRLMSLIFPK